MLVARRLQTAIGLASVLADNYIGAYPAMPSLFPRQPHIHAAHRSTSCVLPLLSPTLRAPTRHAVRRHARQRGLGKGSRTEKLSAGKRPWAAANGRAAEIPCTTASKSTTLLPLSITSLRAFRGTCVLCLFCSVLFCFDLLATGGGGVGAAITA